MEHVLEFVVLYLPIKDILKCKLICKQWREIISKDNIWLGLFNKNYNICYYNVKLSKIKFFNAEIAYRNYSILVSICDILKSTQIMKK